MKRLVLAMLFTAAGSLALAADETPRTPLRFQITETRILNGKLDFTQVNITAPIGEAAPISLTKELRFDAFDNFKKDRSSREHPRLPNVTTTGLTVSVFPVRVDLASGAVETVVTVHASRLEGTATGTKTGASTEASTEALTPSRQTQAPPKKSFLVESVETVILLPDGQPVVVASEGDHYSITLALKK